MKKLLLVGVASGIIVAHAPATQAQVIPGTVSPDIRSRQLQIKDKLPEVSGKPIISVDDGAGSKEIKGGPEFVLKSITIEGDSAISEEDLAATYKEYIGTKISVGTLNKITNDITSLYRNRGFILTRAVLPPQQINGGDVKIRVVEGFVNSVTIQGDNADDSLIKAYGERIRASKPLNVETLERYLLLMEDLPGVEARAVLQPAANTPGASDIVVTLKRKSVDASATLDNRGSRFLGPVQLSMTAAYNNAFGLNEQTQARIVSTPGGFDELFFSELRHEQQIGSDGLKALLSGTYTRTRPEHTLTPFDIEGRSVAVSAGLSYPVLRSRRENWFVNADATLRNSEIDSFDANLSYDKVRVLALGTSYDFVDSTAAINRGELRFAHGIGAGTSVDGQPRSRANADPSFDKISSRLSRIQPIDGPWSLFAAAAGQYSHDPLVASEEFALGGSEFGSAYDAAELTGDSGAAGRLELQYNEAPQTDYLAQYQVYGFYDIGSVWNRNPVPGSEAPRSSLSSTGLGVRFNVNEQFSGGLEGTKPLTRKVAAFGADGDAPRVFFNLQYRY